MIDAIEITPPLGLWPLKEAYVWIEESAKWLLEPNSEMTPYEDSIRRNLNRVIFGRPVVDFFSNIPGLFDLANTASMGVRDAFDCFIMDDRYRFADKSLASCMPSVVAIARDPASIIRGTISDPKVWRVNPAGAFDHAVAFLTDTIYLSALAYAAAPETFLPTGDATAATAEGYSVTLGEGVSVTIIGKRTAIFKCDGKTYEVPRSLWEQLVNEGQSGTENIRAVVKELELKGDPKNIFRVNRSFRMIADIIEDSGFGNIAERIEDALTERGPDGVLKIGIIGDGVGNFSATLARVFGPRIRVYNLALYPLTEKNLAVVKNAGAFGSLTIRDVDTLSALPWHDADFVFDIYGGTMWSQEPLRAATMIAKSLKVEGEAMFHHETLLTNGTLPQLTATISTERFTVPPFLMNRPGPATVKYDITKYAGENNGSFRLTITEMDSGMGSETPSVHLIRTGNGPVEF